MTQPKPPDINILPERYRPRHVPTPVAVAIVVVAVLLFGLMPAYALLRSQQARTAELEGRLDQMEAALDEAQVDQQQLQTLKERIEQTREEIDQVRTELAIVGQGRMQRSTGIQAAVGGLTADMSLGLIVQRGDTFEISGEALGEAQVLDYARVLQSSGRFSSAQVLSIVALDGQAEAVEFVVEARQ